MKSSFIRSYFLFCPLLSPNYFWAHCKFEHIQPVIVLIAIIFRYCFIIRYFIANNELTMVDKSRTTLLTKCQKLRNQNDERSSFDARFKMVRTLHVFLFQDHAFCYQFCYLFFLRSFRQRFAGNVLNNTWRKWFASILTSLQKLNQYYPKLRHRVQK